MTSGERTWLREDDLALIDALHANGRATFDQLAQALHTSPTTVARRWRRLEADGEAWVSSMPGPNLPIAGAIVDIWCPPGAIAQVAEELVLLPQVASVHLTAGTSTMYVLVLAGNPELLGEVITERISAIPRIDRIEVAIMSRLFGGWSWTLGALDRSQRATVGGPGEVPASARPQEATAQERALFVALQRDGRAGLRDLAAQLGVTEHTAGRHLAAMTTSGRLRLRTDFVRPAAGWPVQVALRLAVPDQQLTEVAGAVTAMPATRVCASVVAGANLFATLQLHEVGALGGTLAQLTGRWPQIVVQERRSVLRSYKSWGRLTTTEGRATGLIPVDPWAPVP